METSTVKEAPVALINLPSDTAATLAAFHRAARWADALESGASNDELDALNDELVAEEELWDRRLSAEARGEVWVDDDDLEEV